MERPLSRLDRVFVEIEHALNTAFNPQPVSNRPSPSAGIGEAALDDDQRRHVGGAKRAAEAGWRRQAGAVGAGGHRPSCPIIFISSM